MMLPVCLLTALLAGAEGDLSGAYEAAKARAGDGAEGHVRLALWCEQHGLDYERARNLALAVLKRPDDAKARGLLGMVKLDGRWREAAEAERRPAPEILAHYNARRAAIKPDRADDQAQLALWCERNGLRAEARAHWAAVVQREPSRETAWRHMGYKRHRGRWMTPEQIDAEIAEAKARQKADRHWGPEFNRLRTLLHKGGWDAREAEMALAEVRDPRAVPKLWEVLVLKSSRSEDHSHAATVLARLEGAEATQRLTRLAVSDPHEAVQKTAEQGLLKRDPREAIEALIEMFRVPIAFAVVPGSRGAVGELQVEGKAFNLERFYVLRNDYNPLFELNSLMPRTSVSTTPGMRVTETYVPPRAIADYGAALSTASATMRRDAKMLEDLNLSILEANDRIHELLTELSGYDIGQDPALEEALARIDKSIPTPKQAVRRGNEERDQVVIAQMTALREQARQVMASAANLPDPQARALARAQGQALSEQASRIDEGRSLEKRIEADRERAERAAENERIQWAKARRSPQRQEARKDAWRRWWSNERGYGRDEPSSPKEKPTLVQVLPFDVPVYVLPAQYSSSTQFIPIPPPGRPHNSCFAAGTLVHTQTGRRPIEEIEPGDLVLSQDTTSGALDYHAVTAVFQRKPSATFRVVAGGDVVLTTGIHRFWLAGKGWAMARDLKPGDLVRTVKGVQRVESVTADEIRPVFNLAVDLAQDFFVGSAGVLVHDDNMAEPVAAPFDAMTELAAAAPAVR